MAQLETTYNQLRGRGLRFIFAGLILACVSIVVAYVLRPQPQLDYSKLGIHLLLDDGRGAWPIDVWPAHLDSAARLVGEGGYVVQLVRGDDMDVGRWQVFMDLCAARKLRPILRLATIFDREEGFWRAPVADADGGYTTLAGDYAAFVAGLNWPSDEHPVILLNEPNRGHEWGGRPDATAYTRFVMDVAEGLREADPQVRILNAAMDLFAPNTGSAPFADGVYYVDAETFLNEMQAAEPMIFRQFDYWNSHPYPMGAFRLPPWRYEFHFDFIHDAVPNPIVPQLGLYNRGVNGYAWEIWKLARFGVDAPPIMITETGWKHSDSADPDSVDSGDDYPDPQTAARYLDLAMRGNAGDYPDLEGLPLVNWRPWLLDERVKVVAPFALDGVPWEWGHTNWLQLDSEGNILDTTPMYDVVASYPK